MNSNAFSNHFEGRYRISELRISTWYLFSHSPLLYRKSQYSFVRFLPDLLMVKYHVLSMKYFVDVTLFTKVKEDFLFLWPRTYPRSLFCNNPQRAAQR